MMATRCERIGLGGVQCQGLIGMDGRCFICRSFAEEEEEDDNFYVVNGKKFYLSGARVLERHSQSSQTEQEVYELVHEFVAEIIDTFKEELEQLRTSVGKAKRERNQEIARLKDLRKEALALQKQCSRLEEKIDDFKSAAEFIESIRDRLVEIEKRTEWMRDKETGEVVPELFDAGAESVMERFRNLEID